MARGWLCTQLQAVFLIDQACLSHSELLDSLFIIITNCESREDEECTFNLD